MTLLSAVVMLLLLSCAHAARTERNIHGPAPRRRTKKVKKDETAAPTYSPTDSPTRPPTLEPTTSSTLQPTKPPLPVQHLEELAVEMVLGGISLPLSSESERTIESVASDFIAESITGVLGSGQIESLDVRVELDAQSRRALTESEGYRALMEQTFKMHVNIMIQSVIETHDTHRYVIGAFNDEDEQEEFIQRIKDTGDAAFANVNYVVVQSEERPDLGGRFEDPPEEKVGDSTAAAIAVPIMVVVFVGAALTGFVIYKQRRNKASDVAEAVLHAEEAPDSSTREQSDASSEVEVESVDALSGFSYSSTEFDFSRVYPSRLLSKTPRKEEAEDGIDADFGGSFGTDPSSSGEPFPVSTHFSSLEVSDHSSKDSEPSM